MDSSLARAKSVLLPEHGTIPSRSPASRSLATTRHRWLSSHLKEKWVDGHIHRRDIIQIQQCMCREIGVPLVDDTVRKIGFAWRVVGGENAVEVFSDGHHMIIIAQVGIEFLGGCVSRNGCE